MRSSNKVGESLLRTKHNLGCQDCGSSQVPTSGQLVGISNPVFATEIEKPTHTTQPFSAFASGSFVEFREKARTHVGKIESVEYKASGGARYTIIDSTNHKYNVPDKDVRYAMPCPNSVGAAAKLYDDLCRAQESPLESIHEELDVSPDLIQMAWEEAVEDETSNLTPAEFVELVHAHTPSAMEKYLAWKLLQSEMAHVFFKEIKDKGRVVSL